MLKRSFAVLTLVLIVVLAACGGNSGESGAVSEDAILKVTGNVSREVGWTEADLRGMDMMDASYTDKDGVTTTHTGVSINTLLEKADAKGDVVAFVADDGYSAEATLAEVQGCANCIVTFRDEGGLLIVMPDFSSKLQVKGVVEIQVK